MHISRRTAPSAHPPDRNWAAGGNSTARLALSISYILYYTILYYTII